MGRYAIHNDESAVERALALCKGSYQRDLVMGREALSGATLRGKAASYGGHYAASRRNLLRRLERNGVPIREELVGRGRRRVLVIG